MTETDETNGFDSGGSRGRVGSLGSGGQGSLDQVSLHSWDLSFWCFLLLLDFCLVLIFERKNIFFRDFETKALRRCQFQGFELRARSSLDNLVTR